jgi:hypothetical protein
MSEPQGWQLDHLLRCTVCRSQWVKQEPYGVHWCAKCGARRSEWDQRSYGLKERPMMRTSLETRVRLGIGHGAALTVRQLRDLTEPCPPDSSVIDA